MPRPSKDAAVSDPLRAALAADKRSLYAIAAEAGIPRSILTRFARAERSLSLPSADALAGALGLRLVAGRRRSARRPAPRRSGP